MSENTSDADHLASLEAKLQLVRDRVRGVAEGYSPGMLLFGEGGGGKSYSVEKALEALGAPFRLTNSRMTGRGLFELLRDHPDGHHVVDDCEPLFEDVNALGVLRSALWGSPGPDGRQHRSIVWHVAMRREEFLFTGGLILIRNSPPQNTPEVRAVLTRIPVVRFTPTRNELAAQMRQLAEAGHRHGPHFLPPDDCQEVVAELLQRSQRMTRNLDLRLYIAACNDLLQWRNGASKYWLDLLESRIHQRPVVSPQGPVLGRAARKEEEIELVERIARLPVGERLEEWRRATGKSQAALYRRLADRAARGQGLQGSDSR